MDMSLYNVFLKYFRSEDWHLIFVYSHEIDVLTLVQVHLAVQDYTPESTSISFCMLCVIRAYGIYG
jgi:hypothetical protein